MEVRKYSIGTQFVWISFVSSSLVKSVAVNFAKSKAYRDNTEPTIFVISNNTPGSELWRPRDIIDYSYYKDEKEALYPAGAEFEVTDSFKEDKMNVIKLKLKNPI